MENSHDCIYLKDRNHVFTCACQAMVSMTDSFEHWTDFLGQTDYDVFPEAYADVSYRLDQQVFAGAAIAREVQVFQDNAGNKGWIDSRKYPIYNEQGEVVGLFGIARDVTESYIRQQRVEQLLVEQSAILNNHIVDIFTAQNRKIVWSNPTHSATLGYSQHELVGMQTRQLYVYQQDYDAVGAIYADNDPMKVVRYQCEFLCKDGQHIWVDLHGTSLNEVDGLSLWLVLDITERKRSELLLRDSEEQLRLVLEGSGLGFWDWDIPSGKVQRNRIWAEMLGYSIEEIEMTPQQWADFLHPEDVQMAWKSIQDHLNGHTLVHELTYRMRTKRGDYNGYWIEQKLFSEMQRVRPLESLAPILTLQNRKKLRIICVLLLWLLIRRRAWLSRIFMGLFCELTLRLRALLVTRQTRCWAKIHVY